MSALKPTPDRIELAQAIQLEQVTDHGHQKNLITWRTGPASQQVVTGRVAEFRAAGLLADASMVPAPRPVRLNDAGKAWLAEHGAAEGDAA